MKRKEWKMAEWVRRDKRREEWRRKRGEEE